MSTGSSGPSSRPGGAGGRGTTRDSRARRPYTARYVGSLVADFHRTLLEGGIYLYPPESSRASGKLRLQYAAAPMAFLAEQAGGRASTGHERIMTIDAATPHARVQIGRASCRERGEKTAARRT